MGWAVIRAQSEAMRRPPEEGSVFKGAAAAEAAFGQARSAY